jgi:hypothetical protein
MADSTEEILTNVTAKLYELADKAGWKHLTNPERAKFYERWTHEQSIGGVLTKVMPQARVRVFLKDTVMREYIRNRNQSLRVLLGTMSVNVGHEAKEFKNPQAILATDGHLYTLAAARDWKMALMTSYERSAELKEVRARTVFFTDHTSKRFTDASYRALIDGCGRRLGIEVHWLY